MVENEPAKEIEGLPTLRIEIECVKQMCAHWVKPGLAYKSASRKGGLVALETIYDSVADIERDRIKVGKFLVCDVRRPWRLGLEVLHVNFVHGH